MCVTEASQVLKGQQLAGWALSPLIEPCDSCVVLVLPSPDCSIQSPCSAAMWHLPGCRSTKAPRCDRVQLFCHSAEPAQYDLSFHRGQWCCFVVETRERQLQCSQSSAFILIIQSWQGFPGQMSWEKRQNHCW